MCTALGVEGTDGSVLTKGHTRLGVCLLVVEKGVEPRCLVDGIKEEEEDDEEEGFRRVPFFSIILSGGCGIGYRVARLI